MDSEIICFVCRKPVIPDESVIVTSGRHMFNYLWALFNLPPLSYHNINLVDVDNSEFCSSCGMKILDAMETQDQIKSLLSRVSVVRKQLEDIIRQSYRFSSAVQSSKYATGRLLMQCICDCRVVIPKLHEIEISIPNVSNSQELDGVWERNGNDVPLETVFTHNNEGERNVAFASSSSLFKTNETDGEDGAQIDRRGTPRKRRTCSASDEEVVGTDVEKDDMLQGSPLSQKSSTVDGDSQKSRKRGRPPKKVSFVTNTAQGRIEVECGGSLRIKRKLPQKVRSDSGLQLEYKRKRGRPSSVRHPSSKIEMIPLNQFEAVIIEATGLLNDEELAGEDLKTDQMNVDEENSNATEITLDDNESNFSHRSVSSDNSDSGTREKSPERKWKRRWKGINRKFACSKCDYEPDSRKDLRRHLVEVHQLDLDSACTYCGINFNECFIPAEDGSEPLERPYRCDLNGCGRTYKTLIELKRHHGEKCVQNPRIREKLGMKFTCDQCGKEYCSATSLKNHIDSVHENKFRFYCEICGKGFQGERWLIDHVNCVHCTEKKYECEICHLRFKQAKQLVQHRRRHTGELPFVCEFCGKGFHIRERYRKHVDNMHSNNAIPCPICQKTFRSKNYVNNHISNTHHGIRRKRRKSETYPEPDEKSETKSSGIPNSDEKMETMSSENPAQEEKIETISPEIPVPYEKTDTE